MLLEYRLPSSVETLLKPSVVGRQRDGKEGERETRAMQKGHRVHRALHATTRARTRVELAAKVMTSKGSLTSARQISITARPPLYPLYQPLSSPPLTFSLSLSLFLSAFPLPRAQQCPFPSCLHAAIFDQTRNASTIHHLSIDWPKANRIRALSIDSLRFIHFMIDHYNCVSAIGIARYAPFFY